MTPFYVLVLIEIFVRCTLAEGNVRSKRRIGAFSIPEGVQPIRVELARVPEIWHEDLEDIWSCKNRSIFNGMVVKHSLQLYRDSKDFNLKAYHGIRPRSIVVIRNTGHPPNLTGHVPFNWRHDCYGVLINYLVAVTPCSCVSIPSPNDKAEVHPWNHPLKEPNIPIADRSGGLKLINLKVLVVNLLIHEYEHDKQLVTVRRAKCHPKSNNFYLYDFAMLYLKEALRESKIAWLHTAEYYTFKSSMNSLPAVNEYVWDCEIYQWVYHPQIVVKDGIYSPPADAKVDWQFYYASNTKVVLEKFYLRLTEWANCASNYCPSSEKPSWIPGVSNNVRSPMICANLQIPRKRCLSWWDNTALCNVTRGTPVFCDANKNIRGLMGLMVDATSFCFDPLAGSMLPLTTAIDFLSNEIRLRNSPNYNKGIPDYIKRLRNLTIWSSQ